MGDGFYRSKDPTNSIKVLKEKSYKRKPRKHKEKTNYRYAYTYKIEDIIKERRLCGWDTS